MSLEMEITKPRGLAQPVGIERDIPDVFPGWVLVESKLERRGQCDFSHLLTQRHSCPDALEEILLPVLPSGRIHELVELPGDVAKLAWRLFQNEPFEPPELKIRPVGRFERTWRMAYRVWNTFLVLGRHQRAIAGLTLRRILGDLTGAYRIVTQFRCSPSYVAWIACFDTLSKLDRQLIQRHMTRFSRPAHFLVLVSTHGAERAQIETTLSSLRAQLYECFTVVVLIEEEDPHQHFAPDAELPGSPDDSRIVMRHGTSLFLEQLNKDFAGLRSGEWVMLVRAGDALCEHALFWLACEIQARPGVRMIYADDDESDESGSRSRACFKPDWSPEHLRSTNYIGNAVALRGQDVAAAGGVTVDCCRQGSYDLLLRVTDALGNDGAQSVIHIPAVLLQKRKANRGNSAWEIEALRRHLERNGVLADIDETLPGCRRVKYSLPEKPPLVSIIIPTRDALDLIRRCVESLIEKTSYPHFEILVVDNQSTAPEVLAYFSEIVRRTPTRAPVRVLRYNRPFNFSAINNFAVREARGEVLCLLNNDTEVISADWLEEMVGHLLQTRVGAVGAKLYFPDGRVQHAGDAVGPGGCANHLHSFIERDDPGYCNRAAVALELSAVTAACLVTWRPLYLRLGGLDEKNLKVAFNDVDYCLRVRQSGYRVIWTPHAELYHYESVSRGKDKSLRRWLRAAREVRYMRRAWREAMKNDPFYNPNLSYLQPDFALNWAPRVIKPWL